MSAGDLLPSAEDLADPNLAAFMRRLQAECGVAPGALMVAHADVTTMVGAAVRYGQRIVQGGGRARRLCRVCGCGQFTPCRPACWWVGPDLCSACEPFVAAP